MATGQTLIDRAGRLLGLVESGNSMSAEESADALIALNAMVDSWRNDRLMAYSLETENKVMVPGDSSYTFAAGGDFNGSRPVKIQRAYMTVGTVEYPVDVIGESDWYGIADKTVSSDLVEKLWYNPTMASGTVNVWPVPSTANTLSVVVWTPLADLTLGDTVSLPPGWEKAIAYNLALEIAPEFGAQVSPAVAKGASESLAALKRRNSPTIKMTTGLPCFGGSSYNINVE